MMTAVNDKMLESALDLRQKVDKALSLGIPAETIGAALMIEKGLDPGRLTGPRPHSLDSLLISANSA